MSKMVRIFGGAVLLLGLLFVSGCVNPNTTPPVSPEGLSEQSRPATDVFAVGDLVIVRFTGAGGAAIEDHEERVKPDGTITVAQIGPVEALGRTATELQADLQARYSKIYRNITVTVSEIRYFYVSGEVVIPSSYRHGGNMTVLKAITTAGGFTSFANKRNVQVTRAGGGKPIVVNCAKAIDDPAYDVPVYPNDTIHVKRRFVW